MQKKIDTSCMKIYKLITLERITGIYNWHGQNIYSFNGVVFAVVQSRILMEMKIWFIHTKKNNNPGICLAWK